MPFLTKADAKLFYETQGEKGPWLVLVNGHMRTHSDFKLMARHFAERGFRVLFFDNRGSGQTESQGPFTIETMAQDVLHLADTVDAQQFHLLGISMGGLISLRLTAMASSRVMKLILVSSTPDPRWILSDSDAPWGDSVESVTAKMRHYVSPSFLQRNQLLVAAMAKQIHKEIVANAFLDRAKHQREAIDGFSAMPFLPSITQETLILHGADDSVIAPQAAKEAAARLPHATLDVIPGVGHLLLAECPKLLYDKVATFLVGHT